MNAPTTNVESELRTALAANSGNLGRVYLLLEEGKTSNRELVDGGAAANSGAASNTRSMVGALLEGTIPAGPSLAAAAGRTVGGLLRTNPEFSDEARRYLTELRAELDEHGRDAEAVEREDRELDKASENLELTIRTSTVCTFTPFRPTSARSRRLTLSGSCSRLE
jgi:hypothetical protein